MTEEQIIKSNVGLTEEVVTVHGLMREITGADVRPSVYRLSLTATDFAFGYEASVNFRSNVRGASSLSAHGTTPEETLTLLRDELISKFGKCEHCGSYQTGETGNA